MTAQAGDTLTFQAQRDRIRRLARQRRRELTAACHQRMSRSAADHGLRLLRQRRTRGVAAFITHASEIDTAPLLARLRQTSVAVYLPVVGHDGRMHFRHWRGGPLRAGAFGIPRPVSGPRCRMVDLDLVLLPLLAFDSAGHRLGSGGGYYDRWLSQRRASRPLLVGYAFSVQEFPALPHAGWDVPLDAVVTDQGWRFLRT